MEEVAHIPLVEPYGYIMHPSRAQNLTFLSLGFCNLLPRRFVEVVVRGIVEA